MSLKGKSVIVTGGAAGIGRYIAKGCAERGANVTIGDVDDAMLASARTEIESFGNGVIALHCDVRVEPDAEALIAAAVRDFGTVDYLVNAVGVTPPGGPGATWPKIRDTEYATWNEVFDTTTLGMFLVSKHAIPHMKSQGSGHIVNVHLGYGGTAPAWSAPWVTANAALAVYTRFLAEQERESGICVMAISPSNGFDLGTFSASSPGGIDDRFFLAVEAPMDLSGRIVGLEHGLLVPLDIELHHETLSDVSLLARARHE
jgi:NAD(P)-dependent dehydrogenase (short-subunit alcohol dehydrogenase family)